MNNHHLPRPFNNATLPFSLHSRVAGSTAAEPCGQFDASSCEIAFRIGLSCDVEYVFLPALVQRLRAEAPNATLTTQALDNGMARDSHLTLSIGLSTAVQPDGQRECLRQVRPVVLRADTRPGTLTLDEICQRPHIGLSGSGTMDSFFDDSLRVLRHSRKTVLNVSQLHLIPSMLARTDMLAVVPDYVAGMMVAQGGLRADPAPLTASTLALSMTWHSEIGPAQQWLRSRLRMFISAQ
jgi:LysR family transcriptional activator of mexEF-oprN operon